MVTAAKAAGGDSLALVHAIGRALWAEERFPFVREELLSIAAANGFDGPSLLAAALNRSRMRQLFRDQPLHDDACIDDVARHSALS